MYFKGKLALFHITFQCGHYNVQKLPSEVGHLANLWMLTAEQINPSFKGIFVVQGLYVPWTKVVLMDRLFADSCIVTVSCLEMTIILLSNQFCRQSSSVCYAHSQMQKRSVVDFFWTMDYLNQAVRNKTLFLAG